MSSRGGYRGRGRGRGANRGGYENTSYQDINSHYSEREKNPFPLSSEPRKPLPTENNEENEEEPEEQYGLPDQMQKAKSLLPEDNKEGATTNIQS